MTSSTITRRSVLKTAALASTAVLAAPYVRGAYAAGSLTLGCWDHWVPGANNALIKVCNEWGEKNKVEVHIDYITSQGEKDKLTAAAEKRLGIAQGQTTKDGQISLMLARCVGACSRAPVVLFDGEVAGETSAEQMFEQLERWAVE